MPTAKIIVNPYAGRWQARDRIPELEATLAHADIPYHLAVSQKPDGGIALAYAAALEGFSPIVAVGGDGTCGQVVNGLLQAAGEHTSLPMGIIPLGTANDLAFSLGISTDMKRAVEVIAQGQSTLIDVGRVNGRYFANNSAVGLEPTITLENARLVGIKGTVRYLIATLICIARRPVWQMKLTWDSGEYDGGVILVSVGNGRRTGGLFFMTPKAQLDDGKLDFVFGPNMSRLALLRLLPQTLKGTHIQRPQVRYHQATQLQIYSRPGTPIHADGEVFALDTHEIQYKIIPRKLPVLGGKSIPEANPA